MSYFDYYYSSNIDYKECEVIRGVCRQMCPEEEIAMREREKLVHVIEVLGPVKKFVKEYGRSAADANMAKPALLRPYPVLRDTVHYLLLEVTKREDVSESMRYEFISDRLRAVRQDMIIQRLPPEECISLLEPMIRFHVYYGYKLCELPIKDYDPVLNKKYLLESLKWFLTNCDSIVKWSQSKKVDELSDFLSFLDISKRKRLVCDRILMESLYVLSNLDDVHPVRRYLELPKNLKRNSTIQTAYKIAIANLKGNYIEVCKLSERLCPLTYCAFCLYLPTLQRRALHVMSQAYNSKQLTVPLWVLRQWLRCSSDSEVADACAHYGLTVKGDAVKFARAEFKTDVSTLQPKKLLAYHDKVNLSIDHVFTYCSWK